MYPMSAIGSHAPLARAAFVDLMNRKGADRNSPTPIETACLGATLSASLALRDGNVAIVIKHVGVLTRCAQFPKIQSAALLPPPVQVVGL